jgi:hypothetical protein
MHRLNDKELSERIDRFLGRKTQQFPQLQGIGRPLADPPYTIHQTIPGWHLSQATR